MTPGFLHRCFTQHLFFRHRTSWDLTLRRDLAVASENITIRRVTVRQTRRELGGLLYLIFQVPNSICSYSLSALYRLVINIYYS